jgi:hypothetical protein
VGVFDITHLRDIKSKKQLGINNSFELKLGEEMKTILITISLLTSFSIFASSASDTAEAVTETIVQFELNNDEDTVSNFKGVKASPNSSGVTVTLYLNTGTKTVYGCHRHGSEDPFECHEK